MQTLVIDAMGPTLNQWYAGTHWRKRHDARTTWRVIVANAVRRQHLEPVTDPVRLTFELVFGPGERRYDATNCAAVAKLVEDGLVGAGILKGDSPAYVTSVTLTPVRGDASCIIVTLEPIRGDG